MHVIAEAQRTPNKGRHSTERLMKWMNKLVLLIELACFFVTIALISIGTDHTVSSPVWLFPSWSNSNFTLADSVAFSTANCSSEVRDRDVGSFRRVPYVLKGNNIEFFVAELTYATKILIVVYFGSSLVALINKICFDLNVFALIEVKHFKIRKDLLTFLDVLLLCVVLQYAVSIDELSESLRDYLRHCDPLDADRTLPFVSPLGGVYFGVSCSLLGYFLSFCLLIRNTVCTDPEGFQDELPPKDRPELDPNHSDSDDSLDEKTKDHAEPRADNLSEASTDEIPNYMLSGGGGAVGGHAASAGPQEAGRRRGSLGGSRRGTPRGAHTAAAENGLGGPYAGTPHKRQRTASNRKHSRRGTGDDVA